MIKRYKKNLTTLKKGKIYTKEMEHDACGVGLVASTEGKKSRKTLLDDLRNKVKYTLNVLKLKIVDIPRTL